MRGKRFYKKIYNSRVGFREGRFKSLTDLDKEFGEIIL